jgi:hypothetical protein
MGSKVVAGNSHIQPEAPADDTANALPGRFSKTKTNCLLILYEPGLFQSGFIVLSTVFKIINWANPDFGSGLDSFLFPPEE